MKQRYAIYIYTNTSFMKRKLDALKKDKGASVRAIVTEWIETAAASPRLQQKLRTFYQKNIEMWSDTGYRQIIRVESDLDTLAVASSLAFTVCRTGSMSELCQILINYHFEKSGLPTPKAAPAKRTGKRTAKIAERSQVEDTHVRTSFTMDKESEDLLRELVLLRQKKAGELVSDLIVTYASSGQKLKKLIHYPEWNQQNAVRNTRIKRFNLQKPVAGMLDLLCRRSAGGINRSAMVRVLIRLCAHEPGLN
jgi:hypothetical protein